MIAMKFVLQLLAGAVVALAVGFFAVLLLPDVSRSLNAAFADPSVSMVPGKAGYLLLQLLFAATAAALALASLLRNRSKPLFTIAAIASVLAMVLGIFDLFWFSILVIAQSAGFLWFQLTHQFKSKS